MTIYSFMKEQKESFSTLTDTMNNDCNIHSFSLVALMINVTQKFLVLPE